MTPISALFSLSPSYGTFSHETEEVVIEPNKLEAKIDTLVRCELCKNADSNMIFATHRKKTDCPYHRKFLCHSCRWHSVCPYCYEDLSAPPEAINLSNGPFCSSKALKYGIGIALVGVGIVTGVIALVYTR